jgi:uncharacterized Zn-binding protein involved in type VI secretion
MGKQVQRVGDPNSAGGVITTGDNTVLVNGRPVAVQNSRVSPHPCCGARGCPPVHCNAVTTSNTPRILVNGVPLIVNGAIDTCGHPRAAGSTNVLVG